MNTYPSSQETTGQKDSLAEGMSKNLLILNQSPSLRIAADSNTKLDYTQSFALKIDERRNPLGSGQTKNVEMRIPCELVLPRIPATTVHVELVQPIIVGTYYTEPAYLLRLQIHFEALGSEPSLISRIQSASISVLLEDASVTEKAEPSGGLQFDRNQMAACAEVEPQHLSFVKTFPGIEGWKPFIPAKEASSKEEVDVGTNGELGNLNISARRMGSQGRSLLVKVTEDTVRMTGIPSYLTIPFILTHQSLRFCMRVSLTAKHCLRHGQSAKTIPVLGQANKPLFLDPKTLQQMMETEERSVENVKVAEWGGSLEAVDLETYSSLTQ
jgi:hypothetical protein